MKEDEEDRGIEEGFSPPVFPVRKVRILVGLLVVVILIVVLVFLLLMFRDLAHEKQSPEELPVVPEKSERGMTFEEVSVSSCEAGQSL